ncbi:MAG: glutamate-semialdehyde--aminomutase, partial [Marmoricola sp.]|nr:glutamate-semialdehyde--aminomutase [Marmoricola sp.]
PVYQAGTLSGNPVATAAGLATLRYADEAVYARVDEVASVISQTASKELDAAGAPHRLQTNGNMFSIFFGDLPSVTDYATAQTQDTGAFKAFFHAMLDQGVYLPPSAFEAWFCSSAHNDRAVQHVLDALPTAARAAASTGRAR